MANDKSGGFSKNFVPRKEVTVSDTEPADAKEGDWWFDTGTGEMKFYNGSTWVSPGNDLTGLRDSILDLTVDVAELNYAQGLNADSRDNLFVDPFVDSSKISSTTDINVTTGQNGNASLYQNTGSTVSRTADDGESNPTDARGLVVNPNTSIKGVELTLSGNTGTVSEVGITDSNGNILTSKTGTFSSGDVIPLSVSLESSTDYYVYTYDDGNSYTAGNYYSDSFPFTSTDIDIVDGVAHAFSATTASSSYSISDVTALQAYKSSGTLTSTVIDKGFTPSSIQVDADRVTDADTSVALRVYDGNGNDKIISESDFKSEVKVPFTDSSFQAELQLDTTDASKTPTVNDYGIDVIK